MFNMNNYNQNMLITWVIICIIISIAYLYWYNRDGMTNQNIQNMINDVKNNKELFIDDNSYHKLVEEIYWIDPVYYYDIKKLLISNKNINKLDNDLRQILVK